MKSDEFNIHTHAEHMRRERDANVADGSAVVANAAYEGFYHRTLSRSLRWRRFADGEVHIEVDLTVPPVQMPPRRLPVAIKDMVKAELDEMCRNSIIEPVSEALPWVSALLVVTNRTVNYAFVSIQDR